MSFLSPLPTNTPAPLSSNPLVDLGFLRDLPLGARDLRSDFQELGSETLARAKSLLQDPAEAIRQGKLVAFPTETVYGLGANALDDRAILGIYEAKHRPQDNPLIVHLSHLDDLEQVAIEIPDLAYTLFEAFAPGPLTLVLWRNPLMPARISAGLDTISVRFPANWAARLLIEESGCPLVAPSANLSGKPSPTQADHVYQDLKDQVAYILDTGPCEIGVESTVLDLTVHDPVILRPGAIGYEELEPWLHCKMKTPSPLPTHRERAPKAPGMKYRHYAPQAQVYVLEPGATVADVEKLLRSKDLDPSKTGLFVREKLAKDLQERLAKEKEDQARKDFDGKASVGKTPVGTVPDDKVPDDKASQVLEGQPRFLGIDTFTGPLSATRGLFASFRKFDNLGAKQILAELVDESSLGLAYQNRLMKAAKPAPPPDQTLIGSG